MGWPLDLRQRTTVDDFNDAGYETILSGINHERHPRVGTYQTDLTRTWSDWQSENAVGNAIAYLERRDPSRPFYLNIGTEEPHYSSWKHVGGRIRGPVPPDQVAVPLGFPDNAIVREILGKFQAAVLHMDAQFGRLLEALDGLGLRENTLVVFTTDHGMTGPRAKGTLYDLGVEIALLVRTPNGIGAGTQCDGLISNIDFRPTLAEAAGISSPRECDGRSFYPLLSGQPYVASTELFTERNYHGEAAPQGGEGHVDAYDPVRAIRTDRWHYIRWFRPEYRSLEVLPWESPPDWKPSGLGPGKGSPPETSPRRAEELYRVDLDPNEWINLADRPEYAAIKAELSGRLEAWQRSTGDFLPGPPPPRPEAPGWGKGWPLIPS